IHHKYYIVKGTVAGVPGTSYVATGTHNWTGSALRANDEILVRVSDTGVIGAYDQNFALIWGRTP
ncbi:MAG: phospholipase D family protein, partial [Actinomycetota bacterium]|nr:phospholipase D family protein [Actinomycetota bacterium]